MAVKYYATVNEKYSVDNPMALYRVVTRPKGIRYQAYKPGIGWQTAKGLLNKMADGDPGLHPIKLAQAKKVIAALDKRSDNGAKTPSGNAG